MRLHPFALIQPGTVAEAVDALGRAGDGARVIAGGTAGVPVIPLGLLMRDLVIPLHRVNGLAGIRVEGGALHLGAMVTMADLEHAPLVRRGWSLLARAAGR